MASWEQIVNDVVIGSNFYSLQDSSDQYTRLLSALTSLSDSLKSLVDNTESWTGPAADGFRAKVRTMASNTADLADDHSKIPYGLTACASHLETAVSSIPIPDWMYGDVQNQQAEYQSKGPLVEKFKPGSFMNMLAGLAGKVQSSVPIAGEQFKELEGWANGNESRAQAAYQALQDAYGNEYSNIPPGTPIPGVHIGTPGNTAGGSFPGGGRGGGSGLGGGVGGFHPPTPGTGSFDPPSTGAFDPNDPAHGGAGGPFDSGIGTSLAGLGPGVGGVGSGVGGFGPGGGLAGGGPGGFGSAGSGARLPPIGPSVNPAAGGMGMPGMGGMGAMGGGSRGATRRGGSISSGRGSAGAGRPPGGAAGAAGRPGMVGAGGAGHGMDDGGDRLTWLEEDDDVRGTHNDAPPGVLGG